jgi:hypothetical protein
MLTPAEKARIEEAFIRLCANNTEIRFVWLVMVLVFVFAALTR